MYEEQNKIMTPLSGGCDYVKSAYVGSWLNQSIRLAEQDYAARSSTTTSIPVSYNTVLRGASLEHIGFVRTKNIAGYTQQKREESSGRLLDEDTLGGQSESTKDLDDEWCNSVLDSETGMRDTYSLAIVWDEEVFRTEHP